jgi:hypothetical protein
MGCGAAQNQTPLCVKPTALSGFTTAARQIVGKPTPTAFGQKQNAVPFKSTIYFLFDKGALARE